MMKIKLYIDKPFEKETRNLATIDNVMMPWSGEWYTILFMIVSCQKFLKDISYFLVDTPRVSMICDLITTASSHKFLLPVSHPAQAQWALGNGLVVVRM